MALVSIQNPLRRRAVFQTDLFTRTVYHPLKRTSVWKHFYVALSVKLSPDRKELVRGEGLAPSSPASNAITFHNRLVLVPPTEIESIIVSANADHLHQLAPEVLIHTQVCDKELIGASTISPPHRHQCERDSNPHAISGASFMITLNRRPVN